MTPMTDAQLLDWHLSYLTKLLQPPTTWHFWLHVEHRAKELAVDPDLAELPALVKAEYERLRQESTTGRREATTSSASDADSSDSISTTVPALLHPRSKPKTSNP